MRKTNLMKKEFYLQKAVIGVFVLLLACFTLNAQDCTSSVVTCNDNVQISLDASCFLVVTPDMILEDPACTDDFYAVTLYDGAGNALGDSLNASNVNQLVSVHVTHIESGNYCWGSIFVEDKLAPTVECPTDISGPVSTISGSLSTDDPQFDAPAGGAGCASDADHYYDVFEFSVSEAGMYTFTMDRTDDFDGYAIVYDGFDPLDPCANIVAEDDDDGPANEPELQFSINMTEGCYTLVTTDFFGDSTGDYIWNFTSTDGNVLDGCGLVLDLTCLDLVGIQNGSVSVGEATTTDNCGDIDPDITDVVADNGCDGITITRTYSAGDGSGNAAVCEQSIYLRPLTVNDVEYDTTLYIACDDYPDLDGDGYADVDPITLEDDNIDGAYPYVISDDGTQYNLNQFACNLGATYTDSAPIDLCGGSYKLIRNWSIFDWCLNESKYLTQVIKVSDEDAPVILACPDYGDAIAASTNANTCQGLIVIQDLTNYSENCSHPVTVGVVLTLEDGTVIETAVGAQEIVPAGIHTLDYTLTDDCGNADNCTTTVTVADLDGPVTICDEFTVAALGADGTAEICWQTFDDGSYDNCNDLVIKVKRMDQPDADFTDCVLFTCDDIVYDADGNPSSLVMVRMRAYDITPDAGFPDDGSGRWNECMIEVEVQDKLNPTIECLDNITIDCYGDYSEIGGLTTDDSYPPLFFQGEQIGYYLYAYDNCSATVSMTESGSPNNCGEGTITRRYTVTDAGGNTDRCIQRIRLINQNPFDGEIIWPLEALVSCGDGTDPENLPDGYNWPDIDDDACDQIAINYEDIVLPINDTACFKILREWHIIDWCQFDVNNDQSFDGSWKYTQIIKVQDVNAPVINSACTDFDVCNFNENCEPTLVDLILDATDDCAGDLNYSYVIDAFDDDVADGGELFNGDTNDASGEFPNGTHHIYWTVEDGCGNISYCDYEFKVVDCKKPSPVCINGLASVIMPSSGELELWDTDFNAPNSGSFDNCTAQENLRFRIRKVSPDNNVLTSLNQVLNLDNNVTFTCADLGFPNVELYVIDLAGNWDYCTTYVSIQDPNNVCDPVVELADIEGYVETEENEMVGDVMMEVTGGTTSSIPPHLTNNTGTYDFSVPVSNNYTVTPEKDNGDDANGVTTFDLVKISRHILGVESLDSPYKIIAADANHSESVTTLDVVQIRRLILNITGEFEQNTSWRFVDKDFVFPDPANPFATVFPEIINFNNITEHELYADFIGVKIGDVNSSAAPAPLLGVQDRNRANDLLFAVNDQTMKAGKTYTVDFTAKDFQNILGYQFTLNFDQTMVEVLDVTAGELPKLSANNFGLTLLENGAITASWNNVEASNLKDNTVIFSVELSAKNNAKVSDVFTMNSQYTLAEAYSTTEEMGVAIAFNSENGTSIAGGDFELYQNRPNPFAQESTIAFNLPVAGATTLTIFDVSGKVVRTISADFPKGYNVINVNRADLSGAGMLYYRLESGSYTATKKMIVLD